MSKHEPQPRFADDDAFFTRGELSKALGIGKTTLRHWEAAGKANPVLNANGVWLYSREEAERLMNGKQVSRLAKARAHVPSARGADGELAAKIFDRLDREVHPVEIVKELTLHRNRLWNDGVPRAAFFPAQFAAAQAQGSSSSIAFAG